LGINSATSNLSCPSQQHPIKLANLSFLNCPTALASSYIIRTQQQQSHKKLKKQRAGLKFKTKDRKGDWNYRQGIGENQAKQTC
jgi:hypothetical protein